jgi:uncharacterized protein (TIGR03437 family)
VVTIFGSGVGPSVTVPAQITTQGRLSSTLGGTQVLFDGVPAPLLYTSTGQVAAVVPYEVDGKPGTQVQVRNGSLASDSVALPVTTAAPSIFSVNLSGYGPAAVLNQDGLTVNSAKAPAARGSVISIYATGEGQTDPGGVDGAITQAASLPRPKLPVKAWVDGQPAEIQYAGAAPGNIAGLFQVNVKIPATANTGDVPIVIQVGEAQSQAGMTIAVK